MAFMSGIADQYRIISAGAGWRHRAGRGRLRIDGPDAPAFLQALVTNDVASLTPGQGLYAAYLTPQGRMIADLHIYHRGVWFLVVVPEGQGGALATRLDFLIFAEKVQVADATAHVAQVSVVGADAARRLAAVTGLDADAVATLAIGAQLDLPVTESRDWTAIGGAAGTRPFVVRTDETQLPSFDVFVSAGDRDRLVSALEARGVVAMSRELDEALRIDAGRPLFGVDMTNETIPLEAGLLERAISTTKGCYVGQEVIIRVLHRGGGRVAKRLVKLKLPATTDAMPVAGTTLMADARDVGKVTSVSPSLDGTHAIGLGYVAREFAEASRSLTVGGGAAEIVAVVGHESQP